MSYWDGEFDNLETRVYETKPKIPEKSEWRCFLVGNVCYTPKKGEEPNRFHRWMQRLCFGVRWVKTTK